MSSLSNDENTAGGMRNAELSGVESPQGRRGLVDSAPARRVPMNMSQAERGQEIQRLQQDSKQELTGQGAGSNSEIPKTGADVDEAQAAQNVKKRIYQAVKEGRVPDSKRPPVTEGDVTDFGKHPGTYDVDQANKSVRKAEGKTVPAAPAPAAFGAAAPRRKSVREFIYGSMLPRNASDPEPLSKEASRKAPGVPKSFRTERLARMQEKAQQATTGEAATQPLSEIVPDPINFGAQKTISAERALQAARRSRAIGEQTGAAAGKGALKRAEQILLDATLRGAPTPEGAELAYAMPSQGDLAGNHIQIAQIQADRAAKEKASEKRKKIAQMSRIQEDNNKREKESEGYGNGIRMAGFGTAAAAVAVMWYMRTKERKRKEKLQRLLALREELEKQSGDPRQPHMSTAVAAAGLLASVGAIGIYDYLVRKRDEELNVKRMSMREFLAQERAKQADADKVPKQSSEPGLGELMWAGAKNRIPLGVQLGGIMGAGAGANELGHTGSGIEAINSGARTMAGGVVGSMVGGAMEEALKYYYRRAKKDIREAKRVTAETLHSLNPEAYPAELIQQYAD